MLCAARKAKATRTRPAGPQCCVHRQPDGRERRRVSCAGRCLFGHFANRRQVAAYAGLALTPWQSELVDREHGVSKAGNPRLRTTMIQFAWLWLHHQPHSALTLWFHERDKRTGGRLRRATIVALARKLLVALWRYVTTGVAIEGATMSWPNIYAGPIRHLPGPNQSWRIQVGEPSNPMALIAIS